MTQVGFVALGVDWTQARITHNWSYRLNTECTATERHAVLYFIEQGLMPKNGKRFEWEVGRASHNPLSALFQDYDWADEVLHARIGRDWYLLSDWNLTKEGRCRFCGTPCAGVYEARPGRWGAKRVPVFLRDFAA